MLDGGEDVDEVVHQQDIGMMTLRHQESSKTRRQEKLWRPAVATNTCSLVMSRTGLPTSTNWKDTSHDSGEIAYVMGRLQITIRPSLSSVNTNWCTLALQLNRLGLSLHLQVLVPLIPLSSSTVLTTHTASMKTLNWNLMTTCLARAWHGKSLSTGPTGLRAWI